MKVLVIDVGGTHVKVLATGQTEKREAVSGPTMSARRMVTAVKRLARGWDYDVIAIGYPGPVRDHAPLVEPHNLAPGWVGFDYEKAFGCKVRILNDAAMQALGSDKGGRMLFLGLGTGLGSALVVDGVVDPLELAHLPYKGGHTFEDYVGVRGLRRFGKAKWRKAVLDVTARLQHAMQADYVVLGGGNAKKMKEVPEGVELGSNANAFIGGFRMWDKRYGVGKRRPLKAPAKPEARAGAKARGARRAAARG